MKKVYIAPELQMENMETSEMFATSMFDRVESGEANVYPDDQLPPGQALSRGFSFFEEE